MEVGQIYSLNDGRYWDWPEGLRSYIDNIRQGRGQNPKQYSARYICSLVADLHRYALFKRANACGRYVLDAFVRPLNVLEI